MGIDDVRVQELSLPVHANDLAPGAKSRVDGQDVFLAQGRGQQKLAQVLRKHTDGLGIGPLLGRDPDLGFHGQGKEPLVAVMDRKLDLLRRGTVAFHKELFEQARWPLPLAASHEGSGTLPSLPASWQGCGGTGR